jgi:predicted aspartyl protease
MREAWLGRLTGPAREEATRSPERHLALQRELQQLGFVPPGPIDGVYGRDTRVAILAWQNARGLATTGLIGDADARAIDGDVNAGHPPNHAGSTALPPGTEEIALRNNAGVYVVPVRINGAITLDFIVDSGASDVEIPADVAMTLARTGTITPGDFIGDKEYRLADGSTLKSERFILRELKVGSRLLPNVVASIGSVKGEPLLGQSFLARFGSWSIDNNRHLLALGSPRQ